MSASRFPGGSKYARVRPAFGGPVVVLPGSTSPVLSFNTRTGVVTLNQSDVLSALGLSLSGNALKYLQVNSGATGFQFSPISLTWGSITGTLSSQTDLNTALGAKANLSGGNTFSGAQSFTGNITASGNTNAFQSPNTIFGVSAGVAADDTIYFDCTNFYHFWTFRRWASGAPTNQAYMQVADSSVIWTTPTFYVRTMDGTIRATIDATGIAALGTVTGSNLSGTHSGTSSGTNTGDETSATVVSKLAGQNIAPANVNATGLISAPAGSHTLGDTSGTTVNLNLKATGVNPTINLQRPDNTDQSQVYYSGAYLVLSSNGTNGIDYRGDTHLFRSKGGSTTYGTWNATGLTLTGTIAASNLSGTNTGDETSATILSKLSASAIATSGSVKVNGGTTGLGYATGAGGAVTQLTSRTTGVTLNKLCGAITLFSTTTTAGLVTTFTVTNSAVAVTDTISLSVQSGTGIYSCFVNKVSAGSFQISVYTPAAVGTAEAPIINFAVVKAVNA